jgi:hypothetical protein
MRTDFQKAIFEEIKRQIKSRDTIGNVVSEILSISPDAAYRRYRGETLLTIYELQKLSDHFNISLDKLFQTNSNKVLFDIQFLDEFDYRMESYLLSILEKFKLLRTLDQPQLTISVNNTPFFQLLNYPHLVRFKLFFWAKTHLQVDEYQKMKFAHDKIQESTFSIGKEILQIYNTLPSRELVDPDLLRGFIREIYYYFRAHHFQEPEYAFFLLDQLDSFIDHLNDQASNGKKFIFGTSPPANGNEWKLYYNETLNALTSIHYKSKDSEGLYLAHNFMNFIHTSDKGYVSDSIQVLEKQIGNSSLISSVNEKERASFFYQIKSLVNNYRKKIELELTTE